MPGLSKMHGLRHAYAQQRYLDLTGWPSPHGGGPSKEALTAAQQQIDLRARLAISRELGHVREQITAVYLGGDLPLRQVHQGTLEAFIRHRRKQGMRANTINRDLAVVRRILTLAARLWRDESGLTWLETAPPAANARL
jgi:hypothetical protein